MENHIYKIICEATQSEDSKIAVPALQSLVKIVALYYQHMERYMGEALFGVSCVNHISSLYLALKYSEIFLFSHVFALR